MLKIFRKNTLKLSIRHAFLFYFSIISSIIRLYKIRVARWLYGKQYDRGKDSSAIRNWELDQYLFGNGTHYELYKKMGAHLVTVDGVKGVYFAVWAPHAKSVSVIGEFNEWDLNADMMQRHDPMGIYTKLVPGAKEGQLYKFCIETQNGQNW